MKLQSPAGTQSFSSLKTGSTLGLRLFKVNTKRDEDAKIADRRRALRRFFKLREGRMTPIVDELFMYFQFTSIAKGIYRRYKLLPKEWRDDLFQLKESGAYNMEWFDPKEVKFFTENTDRLPPISKDFKFPPRDKTERLDMTVDELLLDERGYYTRIHEFLISFVAEIQAISQGKLGVDAQKALGIEHNQVEFIFGSRLFNVIKSSEKLLLRLEQLALIEDPPIVSGGRAGLLAEILTSEAKELVKVYAPYHARYTVAKKVLKKLGDGTQRSAPGNSSEMPKLNYKELWSELTEIKPLLKRQTIDGILIRPLKRFTNYKVLLVEMVKATKEGEPVNLLLEEALQKIKEFTYNIDTEVKRLEDIENKFRLPIQGMRSPRQRSII